MIVEDAEDAEDELLESVDEVLFTITLLLLLLLFFTSAFGLLLLLVTELDFTKAGLEEELGAVAGLFEAVALDDDDEEEEEEADEALLGAALVKAGFVCCFCIEALVTAE
jgi:hypothetical protein